MKLSKSTVVFFILFISVMALPSQEWEVTGQMPLPVHGGQALVLDSLIYIFGGIHDPMGAPEDWIQVFNPASGEWAMAGSLYTPRFSFVADRLDDSLVVICGGNWMGRSDFPGIEFWNFRRRGPGQDMLIDSDMNFERIYFTGHIYNFNLYLFGGLRGPMQVDSTNLSYIIRYDLNSGMLSSLQSEVYGNIQLPYHHMSVRMDSLVYLIGGVHYNLTNKVLKYNLEQNTIEPAGTLRGVRAGGQAVTDGSRIYIIGGYNERERALDQMECMDPVTSTSVFGPPLNYPRTEEMAVVYNQQIYVFGGKDSNDAYVSWIEKIDLSTLATKVDTDAEIHTLQKHYLYENYPNPFNSTTLISFDLSEDSYVTLDIFSITGQHMLSLAEGIYPAGKNRLYWNGLNKDHAVVASGVYIYQLRTADYVQARKMMLIR
jgi:hypothetical protein